MSKLFLKTAELDRGKGNEQGYECPFCGVTYRTEIFTRVHITRSDDDAHKNHNGLMPETKIPVLDSTGVQIDAMRKRLKDIDIQNALTREHVPSDLSVREQYVILTAAHYPYVKKYSDLHDLVNETIEEQGLEQVPYEFVRRTTQDFFEPQLSTGDDDGDPQQEEGRSFRDLTCKQQAIIAAHLDDPDASNTKIADRVGSSVPYISQVYERAETILPSMKTELDEGHSLAEVVEQRIENPDDQIFEKLRDIGVFDDEEDSKGDSTPSNKSTPDASINDAPITRSAYVMSASPSGSQPDFDTPAPPTHHDDSVPEADSSREPTELSTSTTGDVPEQPHPGNDEQLVTEETESDSSEDGIHPPNGREVVSTEAVQQIKDRIRFFRRVYERESNTDNVPSDKVKSQLALIREVEHELERLLNDTPSE